MSDEKIQRIVNRAFVALALLIIMCTCVFAQWQETQSKVLYTTDTRVGIGTNTLNAAYNGLEIDIGDATPRVPVGLAIQGNSDVRSGTSSVILFTDQMNSNLYSWGLTSDTNPVGYGDFFITYSGGDGIKTPFLVDTESVPGRLSDSYALRLHDAKVNIINNGSVGIGTLTPRHKLDVKGQINAKGFCLQGDCRTAWPQGSGGVPGSVSSAGIVDHTIIGADMAPNQVSSDDVNKAEVQLRIKGDCGPANERSGGVIGGIRAIDPDGIITCEPDDAVTASCADCKWMFIPETYSLGNPTVTSGMIADGAINKSHIAAGQVGVNQAILSEIQQRVTADCQIGQGIRSIDEHGQVGCAQILGVSAGGRCDQQGKCNTVYAGGDVVTKDIKLGTDIKPDAVPCMHNQILVKEGNDDWGCKDMISLVREPNSLNSGCLGNCNQNKQDVVYVNEQGKVGIGIKDHIGSTMPDKEPEYTLDVVGSVSAKNVEEGVLYVLSDENEDGGSIYVEEKICFGDDCKEALPGYLLTGGSIQNTYMSDISIRDGYTTDQCSIITYIEEMPDNCPRCSSGDATWAADLHIEEKADRKAWTAYCRLIKEGVTGCYCAGSCGYMYICSDDHKAKDKGCIDYDGDGYGNPASTQCDHPERDCDDDNNKIYPGAQELCDNGWDDDCDRLYDENCNKNTYVMEAEIGISDTYPIDKPSLIYYDPYASAGKYVQFSQGVQSDLHYHFGSQKVVPGDYKVYARVKTEGQSGTLGIVLDQQDDTVKQMTLSTDYAWKCMAIKDQQGNDIIFNVGSRNTRGNTINLKITIKNMVGVKLDRIVISNEDNALDKCNIEGGCRSTGGCGAPELAKYLEANPRVEKVFRANDLYRNKWVLSVYERYETRGYCVSPLGPADDINKHTIVLNDMQLEEIHAIKAMFAIYNDENLKYNLNDYSETELDLLFNKSRLFHVFITPGFPNTFGFHYGVDDQPEIIYNYFAEKEFVGDTTRTDQSQVIKWVLANVMGLTPGSGKFIYMEDKDYFKSSVEYLLRTKYNLPGSIEVRKLPPKDFYMQRILVGSLRAFNIPATDDREKKYQSGDGMSSVVLPSLQLVLPYASYVLKDSLSEIPWDEFLVPFSWYNTPKPPCLNNDCKSKRYYALKAEEHPSDYLIDMCCKDPDNCVSKLQAEFGGEACMWRGEWENFKRKLLAKCS